jgi:hypothetical protein
MLRRQHTFALTEHVWVRADLGRRLTVVSFKTKDGQTVALEADFPTLEKLRAAIGAQLEQL